MNLNLRIKIALFTFFVGRFACNPSAKKNVKVEKPVPDSVDVVIDYPVGRRPVEKAASQPAVIKDTKLNFTSFTIDLHNFSAFDKTYGVGDFNYIGDTSQVVLSENETGIPTITAKKDSITLDDDPWSN